MRSYIKETKTIEAPKNIEESLIKVYEADWWRHFDTKNGDKNCDWFHVALPSDLEKACYGFLYPEGTDDFKRSNTVRLPAKDERYVIEGEEYTPQDISVICSFLPSDRLQHMVREIRELYFGVVRGRRRFGVGISRRVDNTRKINIIGSDYALNFPVVYGNGQVAEGLDVLFGDFLNELGVKGSKKFFDFYKTVQEELKGKTDLRATTMKDILRTKINGKSGAEILAEFMLSD